MPPGLTSLAPFLGLFLGPLLGPSFSPPWALLGLSFSGLIVPPWVFRPWVFKPWAHGPRELPQQSLNHAMFTHTPSCARVNHQCLKTYVWRHGEDTYGLAIEWSRATHPHLSLLCLKSFDALRRMLCLHDFSSPASATYEFTYIHTHIHTYI